MAAVAAVAFSATVVGLSPTAAVAARLQFVRTRPSRVGSLGLMDPVCILLCLPFVIYNFVYKYVHMGTALSIHSFVCGRHYTQAIECLKSSKG